MPAAPILEAGIPASNPDIGIPASPAAPTVCPLAYPPPTRPAPGSRPGTCAACGSDILIPRAARGLPVCRPCGDRAPADLAAALGMGEGVGG